MVVVVAGTPIRKPIHGEGARCTAPAAELTLGVELGVRARGCSIPFIVSFCNILFPSVGLGWRIFDTLYFCIVFDLGLGPVGRVIPRPCQRVSGWRT